MTNLTLRLFRRVLVTSICALPLIAGVDRIRRSGASAVHRFTGHVRLDRRSARSLQSTRRHDRDRFHADPARRRERCLAGHDPRDRGRPRHLVDERVERLPRRARPTARCPRSAARGRARHGPIGRHRLSGASARCGHGARCRRGLRRAAGRHDLRLRHACSRRRHRRRSQRTRHRPPRRAGHLVRRARRRGLRDPSSGASAHAHAGCSRQPVGRRLLAGRLVASDAADRRSDLRALAELQSGHSRPDRADRLAGEGAAGASARGQRLRRGRAAPSRRARRDEAHRERAREQRRRVPLPGRDRGGRRLAARRRPRSAAADRGADRLPCVLRRG